MDVVYDVYYGLRAELYLFLCTACFAISEYYSLFTTSI